jgi:hypothetical protein
MAVSPTMPRFAQTLTTDASHTAYVAVSHITGLVYRTDLDPPCWIATTANNTTFRLSGTVARQVLCDRIEDNPPQENAT